MRRSIHAALLAACCLPLAAQEAADWKRANDEVGRHRRGHIDLLKLEEGTKPTAPAPAVPQAAAKPLDAEAAVRLALAHNPRLQVSLAALAIGDADRRQASSLPNPHLSFGRLREGQAVEIERLLSFNVINLLTLPWRARYASERLELAKLDHAQEVIRVSAATRKAWVRAIAAEQAARYLADAREAAEAGAELARRMARVGNFSQLQRAREQSTLAELTAQLARARQQAAAERAQLTRLMGVTGEEAKFALPDRLPDIPQALPPQGDVQAQALRDRIDVRAARDEARYIGGSIGYTRVAGAFDSAEFGVARNTTFDNAAGSKESARGFELEVPLPIFDWAARGAKADATLAQARARVREVELLAGSEAAEAWQAWRTAHEVAKHYQAEIVPLRKFIADETVLRYNGMLASVWELLAETRSHVAAVAGAIEAQRDFWLADTDLQTALTGTSPGALSALQGKTWTEERSSAGH